MKRVIGYLTILAILFSGGLCYAAEKEEAGPCDDCKGCIEEVVCIASGMCEKECADTEESGARETPAINLVAGARG